MNFKSDTSGLDALVSRLAHARAELPRIVHSAAQWSGDAMAKALGNAAPHGGHGGPPPAGDAAGSLAGSFHAEVTQHGYSARVEVKTKQPQKLEYVVKGTGLYGPKKQLITSNVKKALYWEGADHPVKSVKGQKPNDFIKPVIAKYRDIVRPEINKAHDEFNDLLGGH